MRVAVIGGAADGEGQLGAAGHGLDAEGGLPAAVEADAGEAEDVLHREAARDRGEAPAFVRGDVLGPVRAVLDEADLDTGGLGPGVLDLDDGDEAEARGAERGLALDADGERLGQADRALAEAPEEDARSDDDGHEGEGDETHRGQREAEQDEVGLVLGKGEVDPGAERREHYTGRGQREEVPGEGEAVAHALPGRTRPSVLCSTGCHRLTGTLVRSPLKNAGRSRARRTWCRRRAP